MTISVIDRGDAQHEFSTDSSTTISSASFTPTAGRLLVVMYGAIMNNPATPLDLTITDTFANVGPWTQVDDFGDIYGYDHMHGFAYAEVGSSPGTGVVTLTRSPGGSIEWGGYLTVLEVASTEGTPEYVAHNFHTVVSEGGGGATTVIPTLSVAPASTSLVIAGIIDQFADPAFVIENYTFIDEVGPNVRNGWDASSPAQSYSFSPCGGELSIAFIAEFAEPDEPDPEPTDWERTGSFAFTLDFEADAEVSHRRTGSFAVDLSLAATGVREVPRSGAFGIGLTFAADGVVDHLRTGSFAFGLTFTGGSTVRSVASAGAFSDPRDTFDDRRGLRGRRERNWTAEPG